MQDNYILIFNILLYVVTFIIYIRKNRLFSLGAGVLFLYSMSAYMSLELYNNPLSNLEKPTIGPFVYLYVFLLLFFYPLMRFDVNRIDFQFVSRKEISFIDKLSILIFTITLLALLGSLRNISMSSLLSVSSLADNYLNTNEGLEDYSKSTLGIFNYISLKISGEINTKQFIYLSTTPILIAYPFFSINLFISTYLHKNKKTIGISLGMVFIFYIISILSEISSKVEFLKYFSIYTLADTRNVIINIKFNPYYIITSLLLTTIFIIGTYYRYQKKELI